MHGLPRLSRSSASAGECRGRVQVSKAFGMVASDAPAEVQALQGAHIVVLPQSCTNAQEQKDLADMIARAGAKPSGAVKPGRGDRVIVGRAPRARYRVPLNNHIKRFKADVGVLTCSWLESCLLCNSDRPPLPRHYIHISTNTALALAAAPDRDECAPPPPCRKLWRLWQNGVTLKRDSHGRYSAR